MKHLHRIAAGIETVPVMMELWRQPELWDKYPERKEAEGTPHEAVSDVWLRYRPRDELNGPQAFLEPHIPAFYPAWRHLPSLHPIVFALMGLCRSVQLGGILITRIPAGGVVAPHDDRGSWHAEFFRTKIYVPLWSNDACINRCGDEAVVMRPGEAWTFDNLIEHSVENGGDDERITAIICLRTE